MTLCIAIILALTATATAFAAVNVPRTLPDWRIELVAEAPTIRHPSVVCAAPDGRVFVAEDPMDISAPASAPLGRILCFHADGQVGVFAENLYAVFGMQYLDGKLYVLHNPKFSVFTDEDGVGVDRVDLIESTNPNPWALDWNDHVPANFRLGMDGFFYIAVGDKGIYGAVGRDGKRVDLHGGGILRMRPDGTELEVYCTGVRNILDVAMNEEDEFFTYDNTDEQQWMGRVTHMVDGGFYGYPYGFIPRRPYTLWMLADYGPGAATGTLCYNEDALPLEYRDNLFLADFGKRQVMRVRIERDGGSYRALSKEDLFPDPPPDFRPVGIAWSADGLGMFICDWQHRDVKENVAVGRLWKLTFTGKTTGMARPAWLVPAAMNRPFEATSETLVSGLLHPARAVRMVAQRKLAARGPSSVVPLNAVLTNSQAPARARWHALWALDAIDGGQVSRRDILNAANDSDPSVRRQAIRQLGTRRVADAVGLVIAQTRDADPSVRFQAATALGRIGSAQAIAPLLAALDEKDLFTRYALFTALNRIGRSDSANWHAIVKGLDDSNAKVREGTEFALRETYDPALVRELAQAVRDPRKPDEAREVALRLLSGLHHQTKPWRGEWWAYHPVNSPPPDKTEEWMGTSTVLAVLTESLSNAQPKIRLAAINGVREAGHAAAAPALRELFEKETDIAVQRALLRTLGSLRDANSVPIIVGILAKSRNEALLEEAIVAASQIGGVRLTTALAQVLEAGPLTRNLVLRVIEALGHLQAREAAVPVARYLRDSDAEIRNAAMDSLVRIGGDAAIQPALALLDDGDAGVRRSAVIALGKLRDRSAIPALLKAYEDSELRSEATASLAQMADERAVDAYLNGLGGKNAALREGCRKALLAIQNTALPLVEKRLPALSPEVIAELQSIYATNAAAKGGKLFTISAKPLTPDDYAQFTLKNAGDAARGREIFLNESGVACIKCHVVGDKGGQVGPNLSNVGAQFDRTVLIESILYPSKVVREGYNQVIVETKDDDSIAGLFKGETSDELMLLDSDNRLRRIAKPQIKSRRNSEVSLMPEGLQAALSLQEFSDLVAFLESLKTEQTQKP